MYISYRTRHSNKGKGTNYYFYVGQSYRQNNKVINSQLYLCSLSQKEVLNSTDEYLDNLINSTIVSVLEKLDINVGTEHHRELIEGFIDKVLGIKEHQDSKDKFVITSSM